jgi:hypothetical protein
MTGMRMLPGCCGACPCYAACSGLCDPCTCMQLLQLLCSLQNPVMQLPVTVCGGTSSCTKLFSALQSWPAACNVMHSRLPLLLAGQGWR